MVCGVFSCVGRTGCPSARLLGVALSQGLCRNALRRRAINGVFESKGFQVEYELWGDLCTGYVTEVDRSGPKWTIKWTEMDRSGLKWTEVDQQVDRSGPKWTEMIPEWTEVD